jgi:predicted ester cyclase
VAGTDVDRIVDGKIVEQWFDGDFTAFMQQLGIASSPG